MAGTNKLFLDGGRECVGSQVHCFAKVSQEECELRGFNPTRCVGPEDKSEVKQVEYEIKMNPTSTNLELYSDYVRPVECDDNNEEVDCRATAFGRVFTKVAGNIDPDGQLGARTSFNLTQGPARRPELLHTLPHLNNKDEAIYLAADDPLDPARFFAVVTPPGGERILTETEVFVDARRSNSSGASCVELSGDATQFEVHFTGSSFSVVVAEISTPDGIPYLLKKDGEGIPDTLSGEFWRLNSSITNQAVADVGTSTHTAVFDCQQDPVKSATFLGFVYSPPVSPNLTFEDLPPNVFANSGPAEGSPVPSTPSQTPSPAGTSNSSDAAGAGPSESSGSSARSPNIGIIVGGVLGGVALFVLGLVIGGWFMRRRWRQRQSPSAQFYASIGYDRPPHGSSSNNLAKYTSTKEKAERFSGSTIVGSIFSKKLSFTRPSAPVIPVDPPAIESNNTAVNSRTTLNPFPPPRSTAASNGSVATTAPSSTRYPETETGTEDSDMQTDRLPRYWKDDGYIGRRNFMVANAV